MNTRDQSDSQCHMPTASHHALQVALQTLRERCQFFQKRIRVLEEENAMLRSAKNKSIVVTDPVQFREKKILGTGQNEVQTMNRNVADLIYQKAQLIEHISMMASENRQLWRRLSQIAKDVPTTFDDGENELIFVTKTPTHHQEQQKTSAKNNQANHSLIRSRTFTKHSPNQKLRERFQCDGSSEDEFLNLEEISILNVCGFLESINGDLLQLSAAKQDEDQLQAALEANPDIWSCTDGLSSIRKEIGEQERVLKDVFNCIKLKIGSFCTGCHNQLFTNKNNQTEDGTVEGKGNEFLRIEGEAVNNPITNNLSGNKNQTDVCKDLLPTTPISNSKGSLHIDLLLQEKNCTNYEVEKICPMCGKPYGEEIVFDVFQHHVESHFLDDNEVSELSLDRTYEYISHTVGNF